MGCRNSSSIDELHRKSYKSRGKLYWWWYRNNQFLDYLFPILFYALFLCWLVIIIYAFSTTTNIL